MTTAPRPTRTDPEIVAAAAERMVPAVSDWMERNSYPPKPTSIRDTIARAAQLTLLPSCDGYGMAQAFEELGYVPNAELVRILDTTRHKITEELRDASTRWVFENHVRFPAKTGDTIKFGEDGRLRNGVVFGLVASEGAAIVRINTIYKRVLAEEVVEVMEKAK